MADMVRYAAALCAPALAIVARMVDSADNRHDRARLRELNRLQRQIEGADEPTDEQQRIR
jgi:hypothetical protein